MLLKSEKSLGLKAIVWKGSMPGFTSARPDGVTPTRNAPASRAAAVALPQRGAWPGSRAAQCAAPLVAGQGQPVHPTKMMKMTTEGPLGGEDWPVDRRITQLAAMNEKEVVGCTKCKLNSTRIQTVFGEGSPEARLFFIGEGPGESEDQSGRPFVGRAGQLLTKMIGAMGLAREQVYIANIVKCRPPGNRTPAPDEVEACTPYLVRQLETIRPLVIVTLGLPATQYMLQTDQPMRSLRGIWHQWRGIKLMPTYHPSYVLRSYTPEVRGAVWSDLQKVMQELGLAAKGGM